uniref:DUF4422 domain-containing protein n=1 Tax=Agathobacter sp. TaxID=2021311 RepID=UPI004056BAC0
MNVKVIIATHKKYKMPKDSLYLPLHVGKEGKEDLGYAGDNTGENISLKNPSYCELTGLYWAWKNLDVDYLGLAHYRRHFTLKNRRQQKKWGLSESVLTQKEAEILLKKHRILVPKKRKYYIETLYSHYEHTHYKEHLDVARDIVEELYPEYITEFDRVMKQTYGYMFNMYIMEKALSDAYCEWLFTILFELENRLCKKEYSFFQGRFYGRVSEILFNVWLEHENIPYYEIPYMHMEKTNWLKKGISFLKAKFFGKKYEGSF